MEDLLTVKEASAILRVSDQTVRRMIADGQIPARKVGRAWRMKRESVERLLP